MQDIFNIQISKYFGYKIIAGTCVMLAPKSGVVIDNTCIYQIKDYIAKNQSGSTESIVRANTLIDGMLYNIENRNEAKILELNKKTVDILSDSELIGRLRDVLDSPIVNGYVSKSIDRVQSNLADIEDFNNRINKIIDSGITSSGIHSGKASIERYRLASTVTSKEALQGVYATFVNRLTNRRCIFDKADNMRKSRYRLNTPDGQYKYAAKLLSDYPLDIVIISKKSKMADFLAAFYCMENNVNMLSTSADEASLLGMIKTNHNIVYLMAYKLGILDDKKIAYDRLKSLNDEDLSLLLRIELALGLN